MTTFRTGDVITATADVQGMTKGTDYIVRDVAESHTPFGTFVTYRIEDEDENVLYVRNLHLLAKPTGLTDEFVPCMGCGAHDDHNGECQR